MLVLSEYLFLCGYEGVGRRERGREEEGKRERGLVSRQRKRKSKREEEEEEEVGDEPRKPAQSNQCNE